MNVENGLNLADRIAAAGAVGLMTGDYLTTSGRSPETDRALLRSLGLRAAGIESAI